MAKTFPQTIRTQLFSDVMSLGVTIQFASMLVLACVSSSNAKELASEVSGEKFARSRIQADGETEWEISRKYPNRPHIPLLVHDHTDFGTFETLSKCVRSYIEDSNVAGIRGAFLMVYVAASIPHRSGDVMASYAGPLSDLRDKLGDEQFARCLSKMRPEVQSSVCYILFFNYWPMLGKDKKWDKETKVKWPHTFALATTVKRLKWPHDFE